MQRQVMSTIQYSFITVYFIISTWIGYYIINTNYGIQYRVTSVLPIKPFCTVSFVCEVVIYVAILMLITIWAYETCYKESTVHPGMNIVFHSLMLTSVVFFITRIIIFFYRYDTTKIPTSIGALANYFHDSAYFQLPMNPILMTLERLIATKCVRTYELSQTTKIVTIKVFISWTYATWTNFVNAYKETYDVYFITVYMHFGLQTATIILMMFIYRTNLKRYQQIKAKTLTERYQTAENIRLLRATFKFTLINIVWNFMLLGLSFTLNIKDPAMRERIMVYISSIWDLIIALGLFSTLLIFFDAVGILRRVYSPFYTNNTKNVVIKSVTGYVVPLKAEADDYFDQLKKAWK